MKTTKAAEQTYIGKEPIYTHEINRIELAQALNWYNYFYDIKETKKWILEYMKWHGGYTREDIQKYKSSKSREITQTKASIARLLTNGAIFDNSLNEHILKVIEEYEGEHETETRISHKENPNQLIADLDDILDIHFRNDYGELEFCQSETSKIIENASRLEYNKAIEYYTGILDFVENSGEYDNRPKRAIKRYISFLSHIIASLGYVKEVKKRRVIRKPRKTRDKTFDHFEYLVDSNEYNISSIKPEKILESQILWAFDTKYRILKKFVAKPNENLGVHRKAITNWDENQSYMIRLRKPKDVLPFVVKDGKRKIENCLKNLTAKTSPMNSTRLSKSTLLIRNFKK
jgi:hypothetical protein